MTLPIMGLAAFAAFAAPMAAPGSRALGNMDIQTPPAVSAALRAIALPADFAAECVETRPRLALDEEVRDLQAREQAAIDEVEGIWGSQSAALALDRTVRPWPSCAREHVRAALKQAGDALAAHERLFRRLTSGMDRPGAWAGPLRLCRDYVETAQVVTEASTGRPALTMTMKQPAAASLALVTTSSVGTQLAIRLDGKIVARPLIVEPITGGTLQIEGPEAPELAQLAAAAGANC